MLSRKCVAARKIDYATGYRTTVWSTDAETVMWHGATTCKDSKNEENNGTPPGGPFGVVKLCSRSWSASTASADSEPFHTKSVATACLY